MGRGDQEVRRCSLAAKQPRTVHTVSSDPLAAVRAEWSGVEVPSTSSGWMGAHPTSLRTCYRVYLEVPFPRCLPAWTTGQGSRVRPHGPHPPQQQTSTNYVTSRDATEHLTKAISGLTTLDLDKQLLGAFASPLQMPCLRLSLPSFPRDGEGRPSEREKGKREGGYLVCLQRRTGISSQLRSSKTA